MTLEVSLQLIKKQGGSCAGLFCPECALIDKCHTTTPSSCKTVEEENAQRLQWIREILSAR